MIRKIGFSTLMLIIMDAQAQQYIQPYYNPDLQNQVTANHSMRLLSEKQYQKSYQKQVDYMEKAHENVIKIVVLKELISNQLINVNSALLQAKQIQYMNQDFQTLLVNLERMVELTAENPQYAVLITKSYALIYESGLRAYTAISDQVLRQENNYLMDRFDRQKVLDHIHNSIRQMNGVTSSINRYLENAKKKPYFRHFGVLNKWYIRDKAMIQNIITNSGYLIN